MPEWEIASPSKGCSECGREFAPGESYHAQLFDEASGFVRRDLCAECLQKADEWPKPFSSWRGHIPEPEEENRPRLVDADLLMDFFKRLEGSPEPRKQQFRYILGLILMRKKLLKFTDIVITGETEWLVVEERGEKVSHRMLDPKLSETEIESLRGEIGRILTGGDFDDELEDPAEPEPDGDSAGDAEAGEASDDGTPPREEAGPTE